MKRFIVILFFGALCLSAQVAASRTRTSRTSAPTSIPALTTRPALRDPSTRSRSGKVVGATAQISEAYLIPPHATAIEASYE